MQSKRVYVYTVHEIHSILADYFIHIYLPIWFNTQHITSTLSAEGDA